MEVQMKTIKVKYLLITALVLIMVLALSACDNTPEPESTAVTAPAITLAQEPEPDETPEAEEISESEAIEEDSNNQADVEAYIASMNVFIAAFEELTGVLFDLTEALDHIETDDDLLEWINVFEIIKYAVSVSADELTQTAHLAPEEYMESHILIAAAVLLIYDSMVELDHALVAAVSGDYDAFWAGIEGFLVNILAADMLWSEAIYGETEAIFGLGQQYPALVGTWGWEEAPEWAYTFNSDGTGTRVISDVSESFLWETVGNELWLDRGINTPAGELRYEQWAFNISGDMLTIESMQVAGTSLNYIRQ